MQRRTKDGEESRGQDLRQAAEMPWFLQLKKRRLRGAVIVACCSS